jgi:hypothetical protein
MPDPIVPALRQSIALASVALVTLVTAAQVAPRPDRPFAPEQPIAFSHRVHVIDDGIDCAYCHGAARRSRFAGIPSVERCMGCHQFALREHPDVAKLARYWHYRAPVRWVKVYTLPGFVRFSHEGHMRAQVSCARCHGAVESMDVVARTTSLQMGWCVECHRDTHAPVDCLTCHY